MPVIVASKHGELVHLGFENAAGGVTDIAAIHEDCFYDLFGMDAHRAVVTKGRTVSFGVEFKEAA